ncbi:hypothetical protein [Lentimicrobium sp. S6]|uniref:hypothetical protein n=1 Tax=Lentimicrobium sp. S6 TaxID=2735872 RepID=UPI0015536EB5|nr:hypothetical protein [Lentimicrobium sp. S6]NPD46734.1 hypothetical protein [Lentimicrobium sp. S6]
MIIKSIFKVIESIHVKVDLYKINLTMWEYESIESKGRFEFIVSSNTKILKYFKTIVSERGEKYLHLAEERLNSGDFICFGFLDKEEHDIAYLRWLKKKTFYSEVYKKTIFLGDKDAFTMDSYTPVKYRGLKLHKDTNSNMLNYIKKKFDLENIYIIIFNGRKYDHLHRTIKQLGYVKENTNSYFDFSYAKSKISRLLKT